MIIMDVKQECFLSIIIKIEKAQLHWQHATIGCRIISSFNVSFVPAESNLENIWCNFKIKTALYYCVSYQYI